MNTKEKNFALIFLADEMDKSLYNFKEVAKIQNNIIISDSSSKGFELNEFMLLNMDINSSINAIKKANQKYNIYNKKDLLPVIYDKFDYIAIKLTTEQYSAIRNVIAKGKPYLGDDEIQHLICVWLYKIGDSIRNIKREQNNFIATSKIDFEDIQKRDETTIKKSCCDKKNEMKANSINTTNNSNPSPKADSKVGTIDINSINPDDVIKKLKEKIIGQDSTIEDVVDTLFMNQMIINNGDENDITVGKSNILIDGPTGTGKTMIVKELSKCLSIPVVISSITSFSTTGYKGNDLENLLIKLLDASNGNIEIAQKGIICLDEFDKLGGKDNQDSLAMRKALQEELLTYLGGSKFDINYKGKTIEFDTSKVTFIALGAFTNLRERKIKDNEKILKQTSLGFGTEEKRPYTKTYEINTQDYIDEGINREFIGRFTTLTYTRALMVDDYKRILLESLASPLKTLEKLVNSYQKQLIYDDGVIERIAQIVYSNNTGARGLQTIFNPINRSLLRDIRNKGIKDVKLTIELIERIERKNIRSY